MQRKFSFSNFSGSLGAFDHVLYFIIISMNCFWRKCWQTNSYIFCTIFIRSAILHALIFIYNNCFASMYFKFV